MENVSFGDKRNEYVFGNLYLNYFDSSFDEVNTERIDKSTIRPGGSDYFYSQKLEGTDNVVFYYLSKRDKEDEEDDNKKKKKKKNQIRIMGINTIIDGKLSTEEIPLTRDGYELYPFIAKEGYMLFYAVNKDAGSVEIRLERLNF